MNNYKTIIKFNYIHVLVDTPNRPDDIPNPNYMGTGMALAGILKPKQTLDDFICKNESMSKKEYFRVYHKEKKL